MFHVHVEEKNDYTGHWETNYALAFNSYDRKVAEDYADEVRRALPDAGVTFTED